MRIRKAGESCLSHLASGKNHLEAAHLGKVVSVRCVSKAAFHYVSNEAAIRTRARGVEPKTRFASLKKLVLHKVSGTPSGAVAVQEHEADPDTWQALLDSAVKAVDDRTDFSQFDFVVAAGFGGTDLEHSFAHTSVPGTGILADGIRLHHLVYLGSWFEGTESAAEAMIHELGHLFGLPDLYSYADRGERASFKYVGGWDPMSVKLPGRTFLAWHQHKLGFLRDGELACLREGRREVVLAPVAATHARGLKAVQIVISPSRSYVVEVRARVGLDDGVCRPGVLVYLVDATVRTGSGPIEVKGSEDLDEPYPCLALSDATLGLATGQETGFEAAAHGVVVRVLGQVGAGYRVAISKA